MYPLLPALVKLLSTETKNAQTGASPAAHRRAGPRRRNFGAAPIIAMFSNRDAVGKSETGSHESLLNVQNDLGSSSSWSQRSYPAKSNVKTRKKRFG